MSDKGSLGELIQASVVALAIDHDGPLHGVMMRGDPGSGKSDFCLRLIENCPWRRTKLVADDAVILKVDNKSIIANCPDRIRNMIEIRGVGISTIDSLPSIRLRLSCQLGARASRLPELGSFTYGSQSIAQTDFDAFDVSAVSKLRYLTRSIIISNYETEQARKACEKEGIG
ncbi:MAG: HPr kinase/phosphorylase [bacterium]